MNGRVEADLEFKNRIDGILKTQPMIVRQYVDSLSEYTWSTKKGYTERIRTFFKWLNENRNMNPVTVEGLATLLPLDINAFMNDMKYIKDKNGNIKESSSSRQMTQWSALHSFFEFLMVNGFVKDNIVSKTKRPKNNDAPSHEYLSQDQMKSLIRKVEKTKHITPQRAELRPRDLTIIKLFLTTGMRAETLREINLEDIDFENKTVITINKGHKTKTYKIMDSVMESIEAWLPLRAQMLEQDVDDMTGPLFISLQKRRMSYWAVNDCVKTYTEVLGIEGGYSCHKMRHSYGTAVYMMTKDIDYTKDQLGHASISTTQRYINEVDSEMDRLVENKMAAIVG